MEIPKLQLNGGTQIPAIGFGTWKLEEGVNAKSSVKTALKAGYRLIDTAKIYGNERSVGLAIEDSGVSRGEVFVTTKLWPSDFVLAEEAFEESMAKLGLKYLDLYLIHWPDGEDRRLAWQRLCEIKKDGKTRAIGVSNYTVDLLIEHIKEFEEIPAVNQIEFHPFIYSRHKPIVDFCRQHSIVVEAYSPLDKGRGLDNPTIKSIAEQHDKSPAQVMLRWAIQHGTVPIPRSSKTERIKSNLEVFDFELTADNMAALDNLS